MLNVIENQFSPIKVQIILTHFDKDFNVTYDDLYNKLWINVSDLYQIKFKLEEK